MENNYSVYQHVTPDGFFYFGATSNVEQRWEANGCHYKTTSLYPYIEKFGWDNIQHIVLFENQSKENALWIEDFLITTAQEDGVCINKKRSGNISNEEGYKQQYYQQNRQKELEQSRQRYQKNREIQRQRYQKNRDEILEQSRQRYQKNRDEILEQQRQRYQKNREKKLEYNRQRYQKNRDEILNKQKQYYEQNKEQIQKRKKQYYQKNRDEIKKYYEQNKEQIQKRKKQYYQKNRDKILEQSRQRYQRKKLEKPLKEAVETPLF